MLKTDYLVIGAGAAGMAFTDSLIAESDTQVIMVDRQHAPGGHWNHAYPFVRLHMPSAFYGVNSLPLGNGTLQQHGLDAGMSERASGAEVCSYYDRAMQQILLASGQVRYFPMCEYLGDRRFRCVVTGQTQEVEVRQRVVDATYLESAIPAKQAPPFEVAAGARCVPINALAHMEDTPSGYVIIGAGKTAIDACLWLLHNGTPPDDICWIRPRDCWLLNRAQYQPGDSVVAVFEGIVRQLEAAAQSVDVEDWFDRCHAAGVLYRIDEAVRPTMIKGAMTNAAEIEQLRSIDNVVRLGKVRRLERDQIVLEEGVIPTTPDYLHVHCAAAGLNLAPPMPIFKDGQIKLQGIRMAVPCFNAAFTGYIESSDRDDAEKNRLCPPNAYPDTPVDWARMLLMTMQTQQLWTQPDVVKWLESSRLNITRGLVAHMDKPEMQSILQTFAANVAPALEKLAEFTSHAHGEESGRIYTVVSGS
jgi:hypothetical protein